MLVVLLIISILLLLFVPNLSKQKDSVKETGNAAVVKVVDSQAELYEMKNNKTASLAALVSEGQITQNRQIHTMITMRNMVAKAAQWPIRAFTLLESLVTLAVVTFLTLSLSGSVTGIFQQVETNLFICALSTYTEIVSAWQRRKGPMLNCSCPRIKSVTENQVW